MANPIAGVSSLRGNSVTLARNGLQGHRGTDGAHQHHASAKPTWGNVVPLNAARFQKVLEARWRSDSAQERFPFFCRRAILMASLPRIHDGSLLSVNNLGRAAMRGSTPPFPQ